MTGFARNSTTGALSAAGCVEARNAPATTTCPANALGLDAARSVSFSPDGLFAYVAANNSDAVSAFARNTATGRLTQLAGTLACIQDTTAPSNTHCPVVSSGLHGVVHEG